MNTNLYHTYLSQLRAALITARYSTTPSTWRAAPSTISYNKMYYIKDGKSAITINDELFYPEPGDLLFIPEGCQHSYALFQSKSLTKYWCHFTAYIGSQPLCSLFSFPYMINISKDGVLLESTFDKLIHAYRSNDAASVILSQSALLELIHFYLHTLSPEQLTFSTLKSSTDMGTILQYMDKHLGDKITLNNLASVVNIHPNYLARLFKEQFGMAPIQYINLQRIHVAKKLLENNMPSIKAIADQTGFESPYYFSQVFRKHTGLTPTEFRKLSSQVIPNE